MDHDQQVEPSRAPACPITPPQKRTGRPTKLTPKVEATILEAVRNGSYFEPAALAAGVSADAMREWVLRGQSDMQLGRETVFRTFVGRLAHASADNETRLAATLSKGGEGKYPDWRAQAFILERRYRERWAPPREERNPGITLQLTNEQLAGLADALRVARAKPVFESTAIEVHDDEKGT